LANKAKHGIDREEAQKLCLDPNRLVIPARSQTEPRFNLIARIEGKIWLAIFTIRANNIRLISSEAHATMKDNITESKTITAKGLR